MRRMIRRRRPRPARAPTTRTLTSPSHVHHTFRRRRSMTTRTEQLASRLEQGASALADFAEQLTDAQWRKQLPGDGRPIGVVVHHVASMYPIEVDIARTVASGKPIVGL